MGVRVLMGDEGYSGGDMACLFCSTSGWAFGPVFHSDRDLGIDAAETAEAFRAWLPGDARSYSDKELESKYGEFLSLLDTPAEKVAALGGDAGRSAFADLPEWERRDVLGLSGEALVDWAKTAAADAWLETEKDESLPWRIVYKLGRAWEDGFVGVFVARAAKVKDEMAVARA